MRYGDKGPDVQRLQRAMLSHGLSLPRYGADGDFGGETATALYRLAASLGVTWERSGPVPDALLEALALEGETQETPEPSPPDVGVRVYDLRAEQTNPHPKSKLGSGGLTLVRDPAAIDSIVFHQAGIDFADRRTEPETARRALAVACHAMAFEGFLTLAAPLPWYINHANRLNSRSLGLEIDGLYAGVEGRKIPGGKRPTVLLEETVEAGRAAARLLVEFGRAQGMPLRFAYAHRQADSWRRSDPGERLWRAIVLEYAVPVLGLETRPSETHRNVVKGQPRHGLPIPRDWDPDGVGRY